MVWTSEKLTLPIQFDQVRAEQSKLLGVHNEGVEGELKQLKAMAKLN